MKLLSIFCGLTILNNAGLIPQADACSLLPNGFPKCFPEAVVYAEQKEKFREIKYLLDDQTIFGSITKNTGKLLRLGKHSFKRIGKKADSVMCRPAQDKRSFYSPQFDTSVFKYGQHEAIDGSLSLIGDEPHSSSFLITRREVWDCFLNQDAHVFFRRVVTELISKEPLGNLFFFDGIEVIHVPFPGENSEEKMYTSIVREVKYLDPENHDHLRFDGYLRFEETTRTDGEYDHLSSFTPISTENAPIVDRNMYHREVTFSEMDTLQICELSTEGMDLSDDQRPSGKIGDSNDQYNCQLDKNNPDAYGFLYSRDDLPSWLEWRKPEKGYLKQIKLTPTDFLERFVVTKHDTCICTNEKDKTNQFQRTEIEYIAKQPVHRIEHYAGNKLWKFAFSGEENMEGVGVRGVVYTKVGEMKSLKYNGLIKLQLPEVGKVTKKKKMGMWSKFCNFFSRKKETDDDKTTGLVTKYKAHYNNNDGSIYPSKNS